MAYLFVGLGNPGEKYQNTRHSAGRLALLYLQEHENFSNWRKEKKAIGLVSEGKIGDEVVTLLLPETFMNLSGTSVKNFIHSEEDADHLVLIHDEIDLSLGNVEIAFGKGSGGHNGVQSVIEKLQTKNFIRIRIGVCPIDWFGRMKKPRGEKTVTKFLLSNFNRREARMLESLYPRISDVLVSIVNDGRDKAMNDFNERRK